MTINKTEFLVRRNLGDIIYKLAKLEFDNLNFSEVQATITFEETLDSSNSKFNLINEIRNAWTKIFNNLNNKLTDEFTKEISETIDNKYVNKKEIVNYLIKDFSLINQDAGFILVTENNKKTKYNLTEGTNNG